MAKKKAAGRNGGVKKSQELMDALNKQVAGKTSDSTTESALLPPGNQAELPAESGTTNTTRREGTMDVTFKHKSTQKNGINTYSADGYGGSVYLNKSLFAGAPPAEITISVPDGTFAQGTARAPKDASPERVAKAEEKLKKAQERLEKQQAQINKQKELTERLKAAQGQAAAPAGA